MPARSSLLAAVALAAVLAVQNGQAMACRCREPLPSKAYQMSDVVFLAKVVAKTERDGHTEATLDVEQAWKKSVPARVVLGAGTSCPVAFEEQVRYLVYATSKEDGTFGTRRCRGTTPVSNATAALAWLERHGARAAVSSSP
jgi:hypothetical protein